MGFNVSKDLPITVPITIEFPTAPDDLTDLLDINPPREEFNYNLNEVGAFDDALSDLSGSENILVNRLSYEITEISSSEETPLDVLSITINIAGQPLEILTKTGTLTNQSKIEIPLTDDQRNSIIDELATGDAVDAFVIFDLSAVPESGENLVFDFTLYFDITLKARDL